MTKVIKDLTILALFTLVITILVWIPHILALPNFWGLSFKEGFSTIYRNFDGLEYVIIAKSFYIPTLLASIPQPMDASYYPSHFPGYSIMIGIFAPFLGFLKSMLFSSVLSTILATWAFYLLVKKNNFTNHPLFLSIIFLILPARWLIVHSVGSSEPLFIFLIISVFYFILRFEKSGSIFDIFLAGLFGFGAQITRPPGTLLFISLGFYILYKLFLKSKLEGFKKAFISQLKYFPLLLIPLGLLGVFSIYAYTLGDFWAYFHSGDNIHLFFPPFQVFNKDQFWVGDIWLEDIVYLFILGFLGAVMLWNKKVYPLAIFVFTYLFASIFVSHRDISRYILPTFPFLLIAFEKVLTSKEFKIILPLISLAIYLYAQNFILANTAPFPNVELFN